LLRNSSKVLKVPQNSFKRLALLQTKKKLPISIFAYFFCKNCLFFIYIYIYILGIHDLFGTELAMIFSFHVGLTDLVMQRMQFFFLSVSVRHFLVTALPDLLF
jgi:hypothetical protein